MLAAEEHEPEGALLLLDRLGLRARLGLHLPELLALGQDEVHVLVEGLERAHEGPAVLGHDPDSVIDVLHHLVVLSDRHLDRFFSLALRGQTTYAKPKNRVKYKRA